MRSSSFGTCAWNAALLTRMSIPAQCVERRSHGFLAVVAMAHVTRDQDRAPALSPPRPRAWPLRRRVRTDSGSRHPRLRARTGPRWRARSRNRLRNERDLAVKLRGPEIVRSLEHRRGIDVALGTGLALMLARQRRFGVSPRSRLHGAPGFLAGCARSARATWRCTARCRFTVRWTRAGDLRALRLSPSCALARGPLRARGAPFSRHLGARATRLGQADRDGLLAARDLFARSAAPQRTSLAFVHRALHLALSLLAVFPGHRRILGIFAH